MAEDFFGWITISPQKSVAAPALRPGQTNVSRRQCSLI
jgi:hypothetical protein